MWRPHVLGHMKSCWLATVDGPRLALEPGLITGAGSQGVTAC